MQVSIALGLLSPENVTAFWTLGAFLVVCTALLRRWSIRVKRRGGGHASSSTPPDISTPHALSRASGATRSAHPDRSVIACESAVAAMRGRLRYQLVREKLGPRQAAAVARGHTLSVLLCWRLSRGQYEWVWWCHGCGLVDSVREQAVVDPRTRRVLHARRSDLSAATACAHPAL